VFRSVADVEAFVHGCVSGRELAAKGFLEDVRPAAAVDSVATAPVRVRAGVLGSPGAVFGAGHAGLRTQRATAETPPEPGSHVDAHVSSALSLISLAVSTRGG
jgi:hypothetical protein